MLRVSGELRKTAARSGQEPTLQEIPRLCCGLAVNSRTPRVPHCEERPGAAHSRRDQDFVPLLGRARGYLCHPLPHLSAWSLQLFSKSCGVISEDHLRRVEVDRVHADTNLVCTSYWHEVHGCSCEDHIVDSGAGSQLNSPWT